MAIQTGGFGINVMPQPMAVDPTVYGMPFDQIGSGALQGLNIYSNQQAIQGERARQKELADTRDARVAQIKALSDIQVMARDKAKAFYDKEVANGLAGLKLEGLDLGEQDRTFWDRKVLEDTTRELTQQKVYDQLENFPADAKQDRAARAAEIKAKDAQAKAWLAEAKRNFAIATGIKPEMSPDEESYLKEIGQIAAKFGTKPEVLVALQRSGVKNENGVPLAVEAAKFFQDITKPEFSKNPLKMSKSLATYLSSASPETLQAIGEYNAEAQMQEDAEDQAIPTVKVGADGKIERVGGKEESTKKQEPKKASSAPSNIMDMIAIGGPLAAFAKNPALPVTTLSAAGRALPPVAMAYGLNSMAGRKMSNNMLGDLQPVVGDKPQNMSEGLVLGMNQPSTESMIQEARYDDISRKIQSIMRTYDPSDPKMQSDLTRLLQERNLLWSMISGD